MNDQRPERRTAPEPWRAGIGRTLAVATLIVVVAIMAAAGVRWNVP